MFQNLIFLHLLRPPQWYRTWFTFFLNLKIFYSHFTQHGLQIGDKTGSKYCIRSCCVHLFYHLDIHLKIYFTHMIFQSIFLHWFNCEAILLRTKSLNSYLIYAILKTIGNFFLWTTAFDLHPLPFTLLIS